MNCIIIGLSNFGIALAQRLTSMGYEVLGVDSDLDKVNTYSDSIKNTICLNVNNEQAVKTLPLKDADIVFVTIRKDVGASVMAVATMKQHGVKRIIACSISALHSTILQAMGISEIISPEKEYADFFATKTELSTSIFSYKISDNYFIHEMKLPEAFIGRQLKDIQFEKDFSIKLIAIKRPLTSGQKSIGKYELIDKPAEDFVVGQDDIFFLAGKQQYFKPFIQ